MKSAYHSLEDLLAMIDEPNGSRCVKLLADKRAEIADAPGSAYNHQAWPGGYLDHVSEVMNIAVSLFEMMDSLRPLPFSRSDALLVLFFHDVEKPWKYTTGPDGVVVHREGLKTKAEHNAFRTRLLEEYEVELTDAHRNGLKYAEGELDGYSNRRRAMGPLAAFCHMCDVASARLWFAHPAADDPWGRRAR